MKIRLYRGPFDGKVFNGSYGSVSIITGPKKMSREQQYNYRARMINDNSNNIGFVQGGGLVSAWPYVPQVRAEYQRTRCIHPDGSTFYEWTGHSESYGPQ